MLLGIGGLLGLVAVAFAAYADHGLKDSLSVEHFASLQTALRYNLVNAVLIISLRLVTAPGTRWSDSKLVRTAGWLFVVGTVLFCFSIYLARAFDVIGLLILTPFGGILQIAAWIALIIVGVSHALSIRPEDD